MVQKEYLNYRFPKLSCPISVVSFLENTGFKNQFLHLCSFFAIVQDLQRQKDALFRLYANVEGTEGAVLFDRLSCNDMNYIDVMRSYFFCCSSI